MKKIPSYHDGLMKRLKDPQRALGVLNAALEDEDQRVFLIALRDVAEAQGGPAYVSKLTKISREHIYRMLSAKGNPELRSLQTLLNVLGLKLAVKSKKGPAKKAA